MNISINKEKIKVIRFGDKNYPESLKNIPDNPKVLYVLGNERLLNEKSIAIIGCRKCTKYGAKNAYTFGYKLAEKGICVVSGLARGIDTYSHLGAIKVKEKAIAVVGSGLDEVYPKENIELYKSILRSGGVIVSEYPLGTKPERYHFPQRNRIISGLSNGVIVVEAKKKSGTLITVDFALEQGKDVYAIPGNITSEYSYTTNELIKEGAIPITSLDDLQIL